MATPVAIGIDNGGTWIRFVGLDRHGRIVWTLKKPSPPLDKLPGFLKKRLSRFHGKLAGLAVGSRGVWKPAKRRALQRALRGLAKKIVVLSDVEAAWMAAFGDRPEGASEGIIIISGTGSIAYGRKVDGTFARAGGFGPEKGDEGSGYWIGREWLKRTGRKPDEKRTVRSIASLAPKVLQMARQRDRIAQTIVSQAQSELADLVKQLRHKLHFRRTSVSWSGSVLNEAVFRRGVWKAVAPVPISPCRMKTNAATALARSIIGHAAG